jgi:hypothetical protein
MGQTPQRAEVEMVVAKQKAEQLLANISTITGRLLSSSMHIRRSRKVTLVYSSKNGDSFLVLLRTRFHSDPNRVQALIISNSTYSAESRIRQSSSFSKVTRSKCFLSNR